MQTQTTHSKAAPMHAPVTIAQALMFLERHGHTPRITVDGILVLSRVQHVADPVTTPNDDTWCEEMTTFPIDGNVVDLAPIRAWQGY